MYSSFTLHLLEEDNITRRKCNISLLPTYMLTLGIHSQELSVGVVLGQDVHILQGAKGMTCMFQVHDGVVVFVVRFKYGILSAMRGALCFLMAAVDASVNIYGVFLTRLNHDRRKHRLHNAATLACLGGREGSRSSRSKNLPSYVGR